MNNTPSMTVNQSAPFSQEAEEAVLGAVLVNPNVLPAIAAFLKEEDFFLLRNRYVWQGLIRLSERSEPIDCLTLTKELKDIKVLDDIGGPAFITQLVNNTPTSIHAEIYGHLVERGAVRRRLLTAADEIKGLALDEEKSIETVIAEAEAHLMKAGDTFKTQSVVPIADALGNHIDATEIRRQNQTVGIPTGIVELDAMLGGLRKRRLYYVGGRTHMGKTSFMLSVALNASIAGARVMYVSREETQEDLTSRLVALEMGVNKDLIETGDISPQDYSRYIEVCGRMSQRKFWMEADTTDLTPRGLYTLVNAQIYKTGVDVLFVDYLGLMSAGPLDQKGVYEKTSYLCAAMQKIARMLDIPVFVGIQNHRDTHKRPSLTDFEGSGRIEQTADVALLLYREGYYKSDAAEMDKAEVIVAKNKVNGKKGTVFTYSNPISFRFSDWVPTPVSYMARTQTQNGLSMAQSLVNRYSQTEPRRAKYND